MPWYAASIEPTPVSPGIHTFKVLEVPPNPAGWSVTGTVERQLGALVIRSLSIEPLSETPSAGVSTRLLRELPLGQIREQLVGQVARFAAEATAPPRGKARKSSARGLLADLPDWLDSAYRELASGVRDLEGTSLRRGRRRADDFEYRRVAQRYLALQDELIDQGRPLRGLIRRLAKEEGVSYETMRTRVRVAAERNFLAKGQQGKAGREPGPELFSTEGIK